MTAEWNGRTISFAIDRDSPIHEAGWTVVQEPVRRIRDLLDAMRAHTEDAWNDGRTLAAIWRAQRVLRLEMARDQIELLHPDLKAHGPREHWAVTMAKKGRAHEQYMDALMRHNAEAFSRDVSAMLGNFRRKA